MFRFVHRSWQAIALPQVNFSPAISEEERKARQAEEMERQRARQEALLEARQKNGPLKLGDAEAQLKRLSDKVSTEAAERKKRI